MHVNVKNTEVWVLHVHGNHTHTEQVWGSWHRWGPLPWGAEPWWSTLCSMDTDPAWTMEWAPCPGWGIFSISQLSITAAWPYEWQEGIDQRMRLMGGMKVKQKGQSKAVLESEAWLCKKTIIRIANNKTIKIKLQPLVLLPCFQVVYSFI